MTNVSADRKFRLFGNIKYIFKKEDSDMLTRMTIELERSELLEFRQVLQQMTLNQSVTEIKLNSVIRGVCRQIIKEIDRWEDIKKERW